MNFTSTRRRALVALLAGTLVVAACGDDDDDAGGATTGAAADAVTTVAGSSDTTAADTDATVGAVTEATEPDDIAGSDATAGGEAPAEVDFGALSGTITGSGATFPQAFYDEAIAEVGDLAPGLTIEYAGGGSGKGRTDLQEQLVDFAGTDSTVKEEDMAGYKGGEFVYVPTVVAPITVSYNLPGVDSLQLDPTTIAKIFQLEITNWNDPAIAEDNPDATLPDEAIIVARRADGSGTTDNFSKFLNAAVGEDGDGTWTLGSGSEIEWPSGTQAGEGNSGVAQIIGQSEGAIGYVDLSDANANGLTYAAVENKAGNFVEPTIESATAAAEGVEINDDLTFFTGWADGEEAYPIAAQTWIIVYTTQDDAATAENLRGWLTYLLTDGQELAPELDYAPLPTDLRDDALANVARIGS